MLQVYFRNHTSPLVLTNFQEYSTSSYIVLKMGAKQHTWCAQYLSCYYPVYHILITSIHKQLLIYMLHHTKASIVFFNSYRLCLTFQSAEARYFTSKSFYVTYTYTILSCSGKRVTAISSCVFMLFIVCLCLQFFWKGPQEF